MNIIIGISLFLLIIITLGARNYRRIKKAENSSSIDAIVNLNDKNFKKEISKGIVLVDFWADWCMPCKVMVPTLNEVAIAVKNKAKIAKLEVEKNTNISNKYNIRALPTLILFKDGIEIERFQGVKNTRFLTKKIEEL